jgi:hypothetical protein
VGQQNQRFKKPGCVTQVPFDGARIGHGLNALIFFRQPRNQVFGLSAQDGKGVNQMFVVDNFQKIAFNGNA